MTDSTAAARKEWNNPINVAIAIIPVERNGVIIGSLGCKRNLEPLGGIALIGGFQNEHETLISAVRREVAEEAGLHLHKAHFKYYREVMTPKNLNLVFFVYDHPIHHDFIPHLVFDPNEVQELVVLTPDMTLCFPGHNDAFHSWAENNKIHNPANPWPGIVETGRAYQQACGITPEHISSEQFNSLVIKALERYVSYNAQGVTWQDILLREPQSNACGCMGKRKETDYGCNCMMLEGVYTYRFDIIERLMREHAFTMSVDELKKLIADYQE